MEVGQFEVFVVALDSTIGHEIQKAPPCVVVSPDEMNYHLRTVLVAPMSTKLRSYPTRVQCNFQGRACDIALDQMRAVDLKRLQKRIGKIDDSTMGQVFIVLQKMFSPAG